MRHDVRLALCDGLIEVGQEPGKIVGGDADGFREAGLTGNKVDVVVVLVDPCGLVKGAEIEEGDELLALVVAADTQDVVVVGLDDPGVGLVVKDLVLGADGLEDAEGVENAAGAGVHVAALRDFLPVEFSAVEVTAVIPLERILVVGVVVFLADLVAAVEDRDAALGEEEGVQHDVKADGAVQLGGILLVFSGLDAAEGRGRAAQAGVAQAGIIVVELAAGVAVIALAGQVIVEVFLVGDLLHAVHLEEVVVEAPADVVVAAQVVEEGVLVGKGKDRLHLVAEEPHVVGRHGVPGAGHGGDVVEHVALRLLQGPEVRDDLGGLHDDLAQQEGPGADDLGCHAHHADQGVDLWQVAAVGAQFLPDIGRRVQADDVHAVVAEVEHVRCHIVEYDGIGVIEVPLIGIEGGHDDLTGLLAPGEVAGRGRREDLGHGLFKLVGNVPVIVEKVPVLVFLLAGAGAPGPLMVLGGVVHDKVQADAHAAVVALVAELCQVLHGTQFRLYLAEIRDSITAVAPARRALQEGHQVDIIEAALLQVVEVLPHAVQGPGEAAGVHEHAQHLVALVPVRHLLAHLIPFLQDIRPLRIILVEHAAEIIKGLLVIVVELRVEPLELVIVDGHAVRKHGIPVFFFEHRVLPPLREPLRVPVFHEFLLTCGFSHLPVPAIRRFSFRLILSAAVSCEFLLTAGFPGRFLLL